MSILQNLFNKVKGVEVPKKEEIISNEQENILEDTKENEVLKNDDSAISVPLPTAKKIVIMNPLNYSLEKIINKCKLSSKYSYLNDDLKMLSVKNNVRIEDLDALALNIKEEINLQNSNIANLKENYQTYLTLKEALFYIENLIKDTKSMKVFSKDKLELDYDIYVQSETILKFKNFQKLLNELKENFSQIEFSIETKNAIIEFLENTSVVKQSFNTLETEIEKLKKDGESLKEDISKFTITLNKLKGMGNSVMQEYYEQLNESKKILAEEREAFLKEETRINEYIYIVDKSIEQIFLAFDYFIDPISSELQLSISSIKTLHQEILESNITSEIIDTISKDVEKIIQLEDELSKCKNLHEKFM